MPDKTTDKPVAKRMRAVVEEVTEDTLPVVQKEEAPLAAVKTLEEMPTPSPVVEEAKEEPAPAEPKITSFSMMDKPTSISTDSQSTTEEKAADPVPSPIESVAPETPTQVSTESQVSSDEIKEWLNNVRPDTTQDMQKSGGGMGRVLAIVVIVLILVALGGGIYYYRANVEEALPFGQKEEAKQEQVQEQVTQVTETPAPTVAAVDLSKYKVQVLNGSGTSGEAGKAQGYLEGVGFKDFKTGNAPSFGYANTEVQMKKDVTDEVYAKVKEALDPYYVDVTKSDKVLAESSAYDIVVTVGKKK